MASTDDSDSYISFSSEDGAACAPSPLSDMVVDETFDEKCLPTMTFLVPKDDEINFTHDRKETAGVCDYLEEYIPKMEGEIKTFPDAMEVYLTRTHPSIIPNLKSLADLKRGSFIYFGRSLVSTLNIEDPRIRLPNAVICDACIFTQDKMVMVVTFVNNTATETDVCKQYNTYLSRGINEMLRTTLGSMCVLQGVVKENDDISKMIHHFYESKSFMLRSYTKMNPSKCKDSLKCFLSCVAAAKTHNILSESPFSRHLSRSEFVRLVNAVDCVEAEEWSVTLLLVLELTCRIARRGRTLLQFDSNLETKDMPKLSDYVPLLDTTNVSNQYKHVIRVTEYDKVFLKWIFSDQVHMLDASPDSDLDGITGNAVGQKRKLSNDDDCKPLESTYTGTESMKVIDIDQVIRKWAESQLKRNIEIDWSNVTFQTVKPVFQFVKARKISQNIFSSVCSNKTNQEYLYGVETDRTTEASVTTNVTKGISRTGEIGIKLDVPDTLSRITNLVGQSILIKEEDNNFMAFPVTWPIKITPNPSTLRQSTVFSVQGQESIYDFKANVTAFGSIGITCCDPDKDTQVVQEKYSLERLLQDDLLVRNADLLEMVTSVAPEVTWPVEGCLKVTEWLYPKITCSED